MQEVTQLMHLTWGSPFIIFAVIVLLYREIRWACFVGLGVMLIFVPLTGLVAKHVQALRKEVVTYTDKRMSIMSEIINGMGVIKLYAWELPFRCCSLSVCLPSNADRTAQDALLQLLHCLFAQHFAGRWQSPGRQQQWHRRAAHRTPP
jgi:hypothetical protein